MKKDSPSFTILTGSHFCATRPAVTSRLASPRVRLDQRVDVGPLLRPHVAEQVRGDGLAVGDLVFAVLLLQPGAHVAVQVVVERLDLVPEALGLLLERVRAHVVAAPPQRAEVGEADSPARPRCRARRSARTSGGARGRRCASPPRRRGAPAGPGSGPARRRAAPDPGRDPCRPLRSPSPRRRCPPSWPGSRSSSARCLASLGESTVLFTCSSRIARAVSGSSATPS